MALSATDRALEVVQKFEKAGRTVRKIIIEGKRVEVEMKRQKNSLFQPLNHLQNDIRKFTLGNGAYVLPV